PPGEVSVRERDRGWRVCGRGGDALVSGLRWERTRGRRAKGLARVGAGRRWTSPRVGQVPMSGPRASFMRCPKGLPGRPPCRQPPGELDPCAREESLDTNVLEDRDVCRRPTIVRTAPVCGDPAAAN